MPKKDHDVPEDPCPLCGKRHYTWGGVWRCVDRAERDWDEDEERNRESEEVRTEIVEELLEEELHRLMHPVGIERRPRHPRPLDQRFCKRAPKD